MPRETVGYLVSRTTILILCSVLAGFSLSGNLDAFQRLNVSASCLAGIIAFLTVDSGAKSKANSKKSRLREAEEKLHRRIDLQVALIHRNAFHTGQKRSLSSRVSLIDSDDTSNDQL